MAYLGINFTFQSVFETFSFLPLGILSREVHKFKAYLLRAVSGN